MVAKLKVSPIFWTNFQTISMMFLAVNVSLVKVKARRIIDESCTRTARARDTGRVHHLTRPSGPEDIVPRARETRRPRETRPSRHSSRMSSVDGRSRASRGTTVDHRDLHSRRRHHARDVIRHCASHEIVTYIFCHDFKLKRVCRMRVARRVSSVEECGVPVASRAPGSRRTVGSCVFLFLDSENNYA